MMRICLFVYVDALWLSVCVHVCVYTCICILAKSIAVSPVFSPPRPAAPDAGGRLGGAGPGQRAAPG